MNFTSLFQEDDYDELYDYFSSLRNNGQVDADPSGWMDTYTSAADLLPEVRASSQHLARYQIDEGNALGKTKEKITAALSEWEDCDLDTENITLCHSVSEATLSALISLKRSDVSTIIFETPAYGVTINQAKCLGFNIEFCPTYERDDYQVDLSAVRREKSSPFAFWITQPRMSLGYDQPLKFIREVLALLSPRDFLVIDEATEQRFPSHLRELWSFSNDFNILRLRGFLKGAGLNGIRLSFLLHHTRFRNKIESSHEVLGSSLDAFSLRAAVAVSEAQRLKDMLYIANQQTTSLRMKAEKLAFGTGVKVSRLVNGYIGCAMLDLRLIPGSYQGKRDKLLAFCLARRMPILLGASMRFAFDENLERVRLNYFNQANHVLRGIFNLVDFLAEFKKVGQ